MQHSRQAVLVHPHPAHAHVHGKPLSQRVFLEALLMTAMSILALLAMFGFQNRGIAESSGSPSLISYGINAGIEPVQKDTSIFKTVLKVPDGTATLTSNASYTINAKVEGARAYHDMIGDLVPYDLLLAWGDLSNDEIDSKLEWQQVDRHGQVSGSLGGSGGVDLSASYVISHVSNNHLIASSVRIEQGMKAIKAGDMVRIDGRLVDVRMGLSDGRMVTVNTSKSRTDQGEGACEIIYVEHLRINGTTY